MKTGLLIASSALMLAIFLTPIYPVFAQGPVARPKLQQIGSKSADLSSFKDKRIEKMASREAEFKDRLAKFKDKQKAGLVEKINTLLININQQITSKMIQHLQTMTGILAKLDDMVSNSSGKDVTSSVAAITIAKNSVASASAAVVEQQAKDYTIRVSSESGVKNDAAAARNQLRLDLNSLHDLIVSARQAVAKAISTTVSSLGGNK